MMGDCVLYRSSLFSACCGEGLTHVMPSGDDLAIIGLVSINMQYFALSPYLPTQT